MFILCVNTAKFGDEDKRKARKLNKKLNSKRNRNMNLKSKIFKMPEERKILLNG